MTKMERFGEILVTILKWALKILIGALYVALHLLQIMLMLFGLIGKIFLAFVRGATF